MRDGVKRPRVPGTPAPPKRESPSERLLRTQPYRLVPDAELTPKMEQEIRDHFGYGPSEKRTRAQRAQTAQRMVARSRESLETMGTSEQEVEALWQRQAELMEHERRSDHKHPVEKKK